jgi:hypothetical protein
VYKQGNRVNSYGTGEHRTLQTSMLTWVPACGSHEAFEIELGVKMLYNSFFFNYIVLLYILYYYYYY